MAISSASFDFSVLVFARRRISGRLLIELFAQCAAIEFLSTGDNCFLLLLLRCSGNFSWLSFWRVPIGLDPLDFLSEAWLSPSICGLLVTALISGQRNKIESDWIEEFSENPSNYGRRCDFERRNGGMAECDEFIRS